MTVTCRPVTVTSACLSRATRNLIAHDGCHLRPQQDRHRVRHQPRCPPRLDAYTKTLGKPILINEKTRHALSNKILVQDEGLVDIRGKAKEVHVFSVPVEQAPREHNA